ncbi:antichymotrypsin-2-like isoform X2 [Cataglyphis hispanica]|nr:antichymotrypsin-2-like isoform X2 [Cataglyphis hispanica]XP_050449888.1 antichymotrypsin-2-like isoform X2 [Cataglyphis hispanica]XP_050449889.1 antichymotrypsin-2-like isoform X2 [Cataglyphis hispanica]XP_050449890.1 antichymotrypsin-2-like isoform X2 [Cataglyphis hispanica]
MIESLFLNSARGSTRNELMTYLGITDDKIKPFSDMYRPELAYLNDIENVELYLGNAIYVHKSVDLTNDFLSLCTNERHCSISKVDFKNNVETTKAINSWVQEKTNDEISQIISLGYIDKDTKIMLVNVVYLNVSLDNVGKIDKRKFYPFPSKMFFLPTINFDNLKFIHGEIPQWSAKFVEISILNANITITIFLPYEEMKLEGLEYLLDKIDLSELRLLKTINHYENIDYLFLPIFRIVHDENVTDNFYQEGVTTMFGDDADLTNLSKIPLKVNSIIQANFINIDIGKSEVPNVDRNKVRNLVGSQKELVINCPFIYVIEVNEETIFVGIMQTSNFIYRRHKTDEL